MADRTVSVFLTLRNEGFVAGLRQASTQAKEFSNNVQQGVQKNKAGLDQMAKGFATVGLAAGAVFAVAIKHFADFDQAMSNVRAATHETAGNMAALRDAALDAGAKTQFSATQAAGAIENLAKAGVSTKDILGGGLKGALDLAAAGSLDVGVAAETAATAMTQFGLSGKDVPHIADLLAAAAGKAQGEVSDVAMALKQGGLVAAQFGLSIEETTGTLAAFASAGLLGSDAGTSFKTMLLKLANPSQQAATAMENLGIAAYDTKGNFVGIAPLAEELHQKLSKLTPAQRDAALATIFGSDAIRAANVLYKNGAAGISDWTAKVNDQGYAAETAALKTDNLKGDIERLGGALDTALIKGGSGANGALRLVVQGLDDAITGFSELPDVVQQGAVALAGLASVGSLGAAGFIKATQAVSALKTAWEGLSKVGRGLTLSAGGVGLALLAATAIYGAFAKKNAEAKQRADDLRATLDEQTGAITGNTRAYVANQLAQSGLAQKAKDLGLNLSTITDAALGNETALKAVTTQLDAIATNTGYKNALTGNSDAATEQSASAFELKKQLLGLNGSLSDAQTQQKLAAEGAQTNKSAQELQAEAVKAANEAFQKQAQSLQDVISAMHQASSAALELSGSQIAVQAAIDNATAGIKENGRTLDINTEKGRNNRTALNSIAESANRQTDSMLKAGASNESAAKAAGVSRTAFVKVATQMGLSKKQADALAKSLIDIPPKKDTKVTNNAPAAKAKVDPYANLLKTLPPSKSTGVRVTGADAAADAAARVRNAVNLIPGYKNITIRYSTSGVNLTAPSAVGNSAHADGGQLGGKSPNKRADNILFWGTAGEWVQPNASVDYYGQGFMKAVQNRSFPKDKAKGFADGGMLGHYASGGLVAGGRLVDPAYILRQLNTPFNPLAGINYAGALSAVTKANASAASARTNATRVDAAEQAAKARVAALQRAITLQQRYVAQLRAQGASDAKIRTEQRDTIRLQDQLYVAKNKATAATKASSAADAVYKARASAAAKAAAAYKDTLQQLVEQQKAAVEMAGQIASGLTGNVDIADLFKGTMTGAGLLSGLQQQGAQLAKFRALIDALRKSKLSEDLIQQLIGKGAGQGSVIAQAIINGGAGLVAALNKAQKNLDDQANLIGAGSASAQYGVKLAGARAGGGYVAPHSSYLVGEHRPEILRMGSQPGWIEPNQIDSGRFASSMPAPAPGMYIDYQRLAQAVATNAQFTVSVDEGTMRGLIRVEAKKLDDRQALEFATGRR